MAKTVNVDLNVNSNIEGSIKQLKELKRELRNTAVGSEEFKNIFNQIDDLEDKIKSAKNTSSDWVDSLEMAGGPLGALGGAINRAKVATQSFSGALKASGIGLLVSLIGGLVAAFRESESSAKKLQPIMIGLERIFNGVFDAVEPLFDVFINLATIALPLVEKAFKSVYTTLTATAQSVGLFFTGNFKKAFTEFGKNLEEAEKRFEAGTKKITSTQREAAKETKAIQKEKSDADEQALKEKEARVQREIDMLNSIRQYEANIEAERRDAIEAQRQREFNILQQEAETLEASNALKDFDFEQDIIRNEQRILTLTAQRDIELASFELTEQKKYEITKKYGDQIAAIDKQNVEIAKLAARQKAEAAGAYGNALSALASLIGEQSEEGKAIAAAGALVNTYSAIAGQLAAFSPYPIPGFAIAQAVATGLVGFAQVAKILAVNTSSPSPDTSTSTASAGPRFNLITPTAQSIPPNFNTIGTSSTSQMAQAMVANGQQPVKAYVVANEVSSAQSLSRNIVKAATLG